MSISRTQEGRPISLPIKLPCSLSQPRTEDHRHILTRSWLPVVACTVFRLARQRSWHSLSLSTILLGRMWMVIDMFTREIIPWLWITTPRLASASRWLVKRNWSMRSRRNFPTLPLPNTWAVTTLPWRLCQFLHHYRVREISILLNYVWTHVLNWAINTLASRKSISLSEVAEKCQDNRSWDMSH